MSDFTEGIERAHAQKAAAHQLEGNHQTRSAEQLCDSVCYILQKKYLTEKEAFFEIKYLFYPKNNK